MTTPTLRTFTCCAACVLAAACMPSAPSSFDANDDVMASSSSSSVSSAPVVMRNATAMWEFKTVSAEDATVPQVSAALVLTGAVEDRLELGTYAGAEFVVPAPGKDNLPDGLLTSAGAWFAGGGDELFVTRDAQGQLVIWHRTVDEESGFGTLERLSTLTLPSDVELLIAA